MCKYCKEGIEKRNRIENDTAIELIIDNTFMYSYCECGRHAVYKIKYCPMCGRKLGGIVHEKKMDKTKCNRIYKKS